MDFFNGKSILVTGGTGSFGQHFVKKLVESRVDFRRVIIYSRDEFKQSQMQSCFNDRRLRYFIGDVRDVDRLRIATKGVEIIVHAAALKQVVTAEYNPIECINTNIHGAENIVTVAIENGIERVMALSTDKAVNPINLYGATKLCSDKLFVAGNNLAGGSNSRFAVTRYGNVVGSRGSVLPLFQKLVAEGVKTLPVTDERMTRFWITLSAGVEFVMKNFERMVGGEIFVPKSPSIRIVDLARSIASNLSIEVVGIRPGEKVHEILCPRDEAHLTLEFEDHFVIKPTIAFFDRTLNFSRNRLGQNGRLVAEGFEYSSETNSDFLSVDEIRALNSNDGA